MIREDDPPRPSDRISTLGATAVTLSAHRKTDPARLRRLLRRDLDWIVMKALQKDRTRRYQTASDFAQDIQRYLADKIVEAQPPSVGYRLKKFVRRHKVPVVAASLVLFALLGGIAFTTWGLAEANRAAESSRLAKLDADNRRAEAEEQERHAKRAAESERLAKQVAEIRRGEAERQQRRAEASEKLAAERLTSMQKQVARAEANQLRESAVDLTREGKLDEAIARLSKAIEIDPTFAGAHVALGENLASKGQKDQAIAAYRKAIEVDPNNNFGGAFIAYKDCPALTWCCRCSRRRSSTGKPSSASTIRTL